MSVPISLYPTISYPDGVSFKLSLSIVVSCEGLQLLVKRVDFFRNMIYLLCSVTKDKTYNEDLISTPRVEITVKLPSDLDISDVKVNRYVIGVRNLEGKCNRNITYLEDEDEYLQILKLNSQPFCGCNIF